MILRALAIVSLLAVPAHAQTAPRIQHLSRPGSRAPFSPAVRAGDTVYLSGQIGALPDGTIPRGMDAQARAAMTSLRDAAALAGVGFDDMVKCTVMLADMSQWAAFNAVYVTYFKPGRLPARSAFGVDGLALGAGVEIECIAVAPRR